MRAALFLSCLAACAFVPRGDGPAGDDGGGDATDPDAVPIDAAPADAAIDAGIDAPVDAAIDARTCPTAPAGCTFFPCASESTCHYICTSALAWSSANTRCGALGLGCLTTIDSALENACVNAAAVPSFPNLVWFGWRQVGGPEPGGGWGWACQPSTTFIAGNWGQAGGEPNDQGGNEDCGVMGGGGAWIDGDCTRPFRYVCELP